MILFFFFSSEVISTISQHPSPYVGTNFVLVVRILRSALVSFQTYSAVLLTIVPGQFCSGDGEGQGSLACCSPWGCRVGHHD